MKIPFTAVRARSLALTIATCIALTACASNNAYDSNLSPAQNQLRQANARFNQTVGEGAATGAVVGGLAGLALGGRNRGQAALIGAAAGGALGTGAGYLVARNNLSRSSTEAQFNDAIQQASADADTFRSSAEASRQVADQADGDAQRLRRQYQARQITQEQYRAGLTKYQNDASAMNSLAADARKTATQMRQDSQSASGPNRAKLTTIAADMEASSREDEQNSARISRMIAGLEA